CDVGLRGPPIAAHTGQEEKSWAPPISTNPPAMTSAYLDLISKLAPLVSDKGLSAAVYTQTTDVEIEVNGLMTYDREIVKMDLNQVSAANRRLSGFRKED